MATMAKKMETTTIGYTGFKVSGCRVFLGGLLVGRREWLDLRV